MKEEVIVTAIVTMRCSVIPRGSEDVFVKKYEREKIDQMRQNENFECDLDY